MYVLYTMHNNSVHMYKTHNCLNRCIQLVLLLNRMTMHDKTIYRVWLKSSITSLSLECGHVGYKKKTPVYLYGWDANPCYVL